MATDMHLVDLRRPDYHSFLLRVWRASTRESWRGSLHSTATDQICHFDTLDALFTCLVEQLTEFGDANVASVTDDQPSGGTLAPSAQSATYDKTQG